MSAKLETMFPDKREASTGRDAHPAEAIYRLYCPLIEKRPLLSEVGLGGLLIYGGGLAGRGREMLFAANIAGAASIAASADVGVQRQAIRDGVVDFLVTSLEEALRILKNEIRKRQTVSVGVSVEPRKLTEAMIERGVLPDLLPPADWLSEQAAMEPDQRAAFLSQGAREILSADQPSGSFVTWKVDRDFARWLPKLDAYVLAVIPGDDPVRRRWLRLAPRYLGRMAQRERGVGMTPGELAEFRARVAEMQAGWKDSDAVTVTIGE